MAGQDFMAEIADLRKQIEKLAARQGSEKKPAEERSKTNAGDSTGPGEEQSQLSKKLEEVVRIVLQDLEQVPTSTAIAIFALGFFTGRLIPR